MADAITSPADLANLALRRIGYRRRVADLYDGSEASGLLLDIYAQTLDAVLGLGDWGFAQRMANPVLLKAAPAGGYLDNPWDPATYPPIGWQYSFTLPSDYVKVRSVRPQPGFNLDMDPTPTLYNVVNDNGYTPPRRVLVCNIANPVLIYTGQVTNPTQWNAPFIEAFAAALARRLSASLADLNVERVEAQDEIVSTAQAGMLQG